MYDIISVVNDGEFLKYTCYHDHKESSLKKKIKQSLTDLFAQNPLKSDKTKTGCSIEAKHCCSHSSLPGVVAITIKVFSYTNQQGLFVP
jgi:hypothetical protein